MKYLLFLAVFFSLPALADFNPNGKISCEAANGKQLHVNDELAGGQGRAAVSGSGFALHANTLTDQATGQAVIRISTGSLSLAGQFELRLDVDQQELTTRQEGRDLARYYYVPGELAVPSVWKNQQTVPVKCFQAVP
jgi:hypothetical protein